MMKTRSGKALRLLCCLLLAGSGLAACDSGDDETAPAAPPPVIAPPAENPDTPPATPPPAPVPDDPPAAGLHVESMSFEASDGANLHLWVGGVDDLRARPVILEFSPYAPGCCGNWFGSAYNYVQVHARGTGLSEGTWGAVGPRDQQDLSELLAWICAQPWSNGHIGLYGFSASAIEVYNSMHLPLACVDAAALMAGTNDLYRDLLWPGGMLNNAPAAVVAFGVGGPFLLNAYDATLAGQSPIDRFLSGIGMLGLFADVLTNISENDYWIGHTQRPGPNTFPILADTSFYDPEPRGPFESYQMLRDLGTLVHFRTFGAHDGTPTGHPGPFPQYKRWFDRWLLDIDNGIEDEPRVQLLISKGSFESYKAGDFVELEGADWPLPGTRWQRLYLSGEASGSATSANDGSLSPAAPDAQTLHPYLGVVSLPTATDPHTTGTVAAAGAAALFDAMPFLTQMQLMEPLSLTYTTPEFSQDVDVVGPANLDLFVTTVLPIADLYAVVADVWPDGSSHAVGVGRLRTAYPDIVPGRSKLDEHGEVVQPYGDYSAMTPATPGEQREYHIEFWPIGNRFQTGHRLRLYLTGTSGYLLPLPGLNLVALGGATPSRLLLPVLPGSDACAAMGAASSC